VTALRNLRQNRRLPVRRISYPGTRIERKDIVLLRHTLVVSLDLTMIRGDAYFKAGVLNELFAHAKGKRAGRCAYPRAQPDQWPRFKRWCRALRYWETGNRRMGRRNRRPVCGSGRCGGSDVGGTRNFRDIAKRWRHLAHSTRMLRPLRGRTFPASRQTTDTQLAAQVRPGDAAEINASECQTIAAPSWPEVIRGQVHEERSTPAW